MLFALHDVTKTYGPITALRQLTVSVPPGAVGLLGPTDPTLREAPVDRLVLFGVTAGVVLWTGVWLPGSIVT